MKELEEIKSKYITYSVSKEGLYNSTTDVDKMLKEAYNLAIDKCIENAEVEIRDFGYTATLDKESLEKLKL